jgi:hypothetical protein
VFPRKLSPPKDPPPSFQDQRAELDGSGTISRSSHRDSSPGKRASPVHHEHTHQLRDTNEDAERLEEEIRDLELQLHLAAIESDNSSLGGE